ncbi:MAG: hypothetical protein ACP5JF_06920 [Candidatus Methanodesulfokora sp.]
MDGGHLISERMEEEEQLSPLLYYFSCIIGGIILYVPLWILGLSVLPHYIKFIEPYPLEESALVGLGHGIGMGIFDGWHEKRRKKKAR